MNGFGRLILSMTTASDPPLQLKTDIPWLFAYKLLNLINYLNELLLSLKNPGISNCFYRKHFDDVQLDV